MNRSIAKNFIYNLLLQIVTLFLPLITVPHLSRILGKEGIGIFSFTFSTVQYFIILGTLGISMYGNRQIAYVRDDKLELSKTFWSITFLKIITASVAFIMYILFFGLNSSYGFIYLIQSINIFAAMLDISWLYMGLEDFKKTVTRNLIVKIAGVACIYIFVKNYSDIYVYTIINGLMNLFGNLIMWKYIPRTVLMVKIKMSDISKHIFPTLKLFVPQIAIQVYAVLDKTMLGTLVNTGEVGLYDQAQKIIQLVLGLVTALGVVMLPRMSNTFAIGDSKKMDEYFNTSLLIVSYGSIPMTVGLASVSNEFVPWFFGKDFSSVSILLIILTPIIFLIAISNVIGIQYLLPSNRTKEFTTSVMIGAIVNVTLNFLLIPKYKAVGTCIATVVAEFSVTLVQLLSVRINIRKSYLLRGIIKYILASIVMLIIVRLIGANMGAKFITTGVQVIVGIFIYIGTLIFLRDDLSLSIIRFMASKLTIKVRA